MVVRALILRAPGTNCDVETAFAIEKAGARAFLVHIGELARGEKSLNDYQIVVIPGGFTYGDYLGAGKILANEIRKRLASDLEHFIARGGLVLGICNGFQALVKAGFLPGSANHTQTASITFNDSGKFECRWVHLSVNPDSRCIFTRGLGKLYMPVAHGEGKFVTDAETLKEIDAPIFYTDENGGKAGYPWNPNGSVENIAGVSDKSGRVLGLMPHPERHVEPSHHPRWMAGSDQGSGFGIFVNAVKWAREI